jgi:hypothetical protein
VCVWVFEGGGVERERERARARETESFIRNFPKSQC